MGTAAFVVASFLSIPYSEVAKAAFIPAVLYYESLFIGVTAAAHTYDVKAVAAASAVPNLWKTFKDGWYYILSIVVLVYFLIVASEESAAPFYATAVLLAIAVIKKKDRLDWSRFINLIEKASGTLVMLASFWQAWV
jgi:TRAP-type uncharacterized transport system fused permease subunit